MFRSRYFLAHYFRAEYFGRAGAVAAAQVETMVVTITATIGAMTVSPTAASVTVTEKGQA
jgi:hypothetical protein